MFIGMGRGGPFTVLLGLFIYLLIGCGYVLIYGIAVTCILLKYAYLGIRYLYRRHKRGKEIHAPAPTIPLDAPKPYMSPVQKREYPPNDWS